MQSNCRYEMRICKNKLDIMTAAIDTCAIAPSDSIAPLYASRLSELL